MPYSFVYFAFSYSKEKYFLAAKIRFCPLFNKNTNPKEDKITLKTKPMSASCIRFFAIKEKSTTRRAKIIKLWNEEEFARIFAKFS